MPLSSLLSSIPGIVHGFGNAAALVPAALQPAWDQRPDKRQVHGRALAEVTTPRQACGEVDGLFSAAPGIPVSVITADCVPILLARRDGGMVAALHAGWRGLDAGLIEALWETLDARGERPADWVAAIGPAIGACCYEVSADLVAQFRARFADMDPLAVSADGRMLDLPAIAAFSLARAGVGAVERLEDACTRCREHAGDFVYRSYRRGDRGSQQHAGLMILPPYFMA